MAIDGDPRARPCGGVTVPSDGHGGAGAPTLFDGDRGTVYLLAEEQARPEERGLHHASATGGVQLAVPAGDEREGRVGVESHPGVCVGVAVWDPAWDNVVFDAGGGGEVEGGGRGECGAVG